MTIDQSAPRPSIRSVASGVTGMVLVGGSVGVSHELIDAPLFTAQAIRYAAAALVLVAFARVGRVRLVRPRGREWLWLVGVAATGLVLFNVAIVRGVAHAEPAVIAVAVACVPILLGVIGPLLEHQTPSRPLLSAAAVVTAGAALVEGTGATDGTGVAWAAVALGCEAGFTLLAVPVLGRLGGWGVSIHAVWIGAVMFAVLAGVAEGPTAAGQLTARDYAAMACLALFVTAAAFVLWYSSVAALGAARAGLLTGVAPISAAITGMVTASIAPGPFVWIGIAIVLCGLAAGLRHAQGPAGPTARTNVVTAVATVAGSRLSE